MILDIVIYLASIVIGALALFFNVAFGWAFPAFVDTWTGMIVEWLVKLNGLVPMVADPVNGTGLYASVGILDLISWFIGVLLLFAGVRLVYHLLSFTKWLSPRKPIVFIR